MPSRRCFGFAGFRSSRKGVERSPKQARKLPDHVKPLLEVQVLKTSCLQQKAEILRHQDALTRITERGRNAEARIKKAKEASLHLRKELEVSSFRKLEPSPLPPELPELPDSPEGGRIGRLKDMVVSETSRLASSLADRRKLNRCLELEVHTLKSAHAALLDLGDRHTVDSAALHKRNEALAKQQEEVTEKSQEYKSRYWQDQAPYQGEMGLDEKEVAALQLCVAKLHSDLSSLEAQLAQAKTEAQNASKEACEAANMALEKYEALEHRAPIPVPLEDQATMARRLNLSSMEDGLREADTAQSREATTLDRGELSIALSSIPNEDASSHASGANPEQQEREVESREPQMLQPLDSSSIFDADESTLPEVEGSLPSAEKILEPMQELHDLLARSSTDLSSHNSFVNRLLSNYPKPKPSEPETVQEHVDAFTPSHLNQQLAATTAQNDSLRDEISHHKELLRQRLLRQQIAQECLKIELQSLRAST